MVITFDQDINSSTLCSYWANDGSDKTTAGTGRTITATLENAGGVGSNDAHLLRQRRAAGRATSVRSTSAPTAMPPAPAPTRAARRSGTSSAKTLTITLGARSGNVTSVTSSNATYAPSSLVKNQSGTAITGTFSTGSQKQF